MVKAVETRIYRLHYDPHTSERIGYLASQQRLAYNIAVNILNRTSAIALRRPPAHPDGLLGQITLWRHQDSRAQAPYIIHQAGAQQAWMANDLMRRERKARLGRLENGSTHSSDHRQHRRTLTRRSRKHGSSTLTSLIPPVRLDDVTFTIAGARDVTLRTKKSVPDELDIRSFQLVEVRKDCRTENGVLRKRRYALHLQVAVEYPETFKPEAIGSADEILGVDDGVKRQLTLSNGDVLRHDERDKINRQRRMREKAQRRKRGSRRRARLCCCSAIPSALTAQRKCPHDGACDIDAARTGKTSGTQQLTGRIYDDGAGSDTDGSEHTPHHAHTGGISTGGSSRTRSRQQRSQTCQRYTARDG